MITRRTFLRRGLGTAAALSSLGQAARILAAEAPVPRASPVIDTMTPDGPDFDVRAALAGGLTAAVLDLRLFPRNFPNALEKLEDLPLSSDPNIDRSSDCCPQIQLE
jgi:hypothetical protein